MKYLTVKEAAEQLGCSAHLIYALCARRRLAHARMGLGRGRIRIRDTDLDRFIDGASVPVDEPRPPKPPPIRLKHLRI